MDAGGAVGPSSSLSWIFFNSGESLYNVAVYMSAMTKASCCVCRVTPTKELPLLMGCAPMLYIRTDVDTYSGLEELPLATMEAQWVVSMPTIYCLVQVQVALLASTLT